MKTTQIQFDIQTGRIIGAHHNAGAVEKTRPVNQRHTMSKARQVATMTVNSAAYQPGRSYKVDVANKALVEVSEAEGGIGFSVGKTGRFP